MRIESNLPETSMIEIEGLNIRAAKSVARPGAPLLLTAPWPESIFAFDLVWKKIEELGPVTVVDLPGFGMSEGRADLMSPSAMGDFLIRLMDELKLDRAHVIAPDVGTLATLFAAAKNPSRFHSIVGGSGGTRMDLLGESLRQIVNSKHSDFSNSDGGEQVYQLVSSSARVAIGEAILQDYRRSSAGQRWNDAADFVRAYATDLPRLEDLLPGIGTPTLIISGKDDPFVPPANGDFLANKMPNCRHEVLEAGHFVWEDAADSYASLISSWVSDLNAQA